ncbi:MAG TPA: choline/ethanolamine kinase family protein [Anaerolineales bacterium]|nr:choline/ethanolamine kinase family protein [Anaerolineales bacterium]
MPASVGAIIARVPGWKDDPDLRVTPLGGGITNRNFRIDTRGQSFVLRLAGERTEKLGIDRRVERAANEAAAAIGLAPEVVHFLEPEGYLVTRFVDGRPLSAEELGRPDMIRRVAAALRAFHALSAIPGAFSAFHVVRDYAAAARRLGVVLPETFDHLKQHLDEVERRLPTTAACPCHNDLLNANFLEAEGRLYILDWEYAGMGDAFFDLANFSRNHNFSLEQDELLLAALDGSVAPARLARLRLMRFASDMREAMWGVLQSGLSSLDFDFRGYAEQHFQRAAEGIGDPQWSTWLKEAVHGI